MTFAMLAAFDDKLFVFSTVLHPYRAEVQSEGHFPYDAEELAHALL